MSARKVNEGEKVCFIILKIHSLRIYIEILASCSFVANMDLFLYFFHLSLC
jgi:hypothetical protein